MGVFVTLTVAPVLSEVLESSLVSDPSEDVEAVPVEDSTAASEEAAETADSIVEAPCKSSSCEYEVFSITSVGKVREDSVVLSFLLFITANTMLNTAMSAINTDPMMIIVFFVNILLII